MGSGKRDDVREGRYRPIVLWTGAALVIKIRPGAFSSFRNGTMEVTQIIQQIEAGDPVAVRDLLPMVYQELRRLAAAQLAREQPGLTLQPTALVHEAYLRLMGDNGSVSFANRRHFFGAAAEAMRRILVDNARRRGRVKHGGQMGRVELNDPEDREMNEELLALDKALPKLAEEDPMAAEVVRLKYFAGLSREMIAATLGQTVHQVRQKWEYARAWLRLALQE